MLCTKQVPEELLRLDVMAQRRREDGAAELPAAQNTGSQAQARSFNLYNLYNTVHMYLSTLLPVQGR